MLWRPIKHIDQKLLTNLSILELFHELLPLKEFDILIVDSSEIWIWINRITTSETRHLNQLTLWSWVSPEKGCWVGLEFSIGSWLCHPRTRKSGLAVRRQFTIAQFLVDDGGICFFSGLGLVMINNWGSTQNPDSESTNLLLIRAVL